MTQGRMTYRRLGGWTRALVVFAGHADLWWLRLLKPGFRHCFVALGDGRIWVSIEPLSHCTEVVVTPVHGPFDLAAHYRAQGLTVVETVVRNVPSTPMPWRPFTCVEGVKRVLGLRAPWVWTPWDLYRCLTEEKKSERDRKKSVDGSEQNKYI